MAEPNGPNEYLHRFHFHLGRALHGLRLQKARSAGFKEIILETVGK
jgi:hypothetical protein